MVNVEKKSMRDVFGETLIELFPRYPNMIVLDADLSGSTKSKEFGARFPDRFFNVGVAEQNMMAWAAGSDFCWAATPVVCSFGVFLSMRAAQQFRQMIAYTKLNVKVMGHYGGVSDSHYGPTHQTTEHSDHPLHTEYHTDRALRWKRGPGWNSRLPSITRGQSIFVSAGTRCSKSLWKS